MTTYTDRDDGRSISLTPGEGFEIRLSENPTTGYRWQLDEWERAILELTRDEFHPPDLAPYGAGGEHGWRFVARAPGQTSLHLAYRRGQGSGAPARTFSLDVAVT
jgi:inhibitor of cysteine peptidase